MNRASNEVRDQPDARWARTRKRLLEGGRLVFAERGVEATSVLDIVRAAGVSQPSFYNHFESKEALAEEIAAEYFRRDKQAKQAIFEVIADPAEAIAINVGQTLEIVDDDPVIAQAIVRSESLRQLVISRDNDPLAKMVENGVSKKRFDACNARTAALAIRGGAFAVMQDMLKGNASGSAARDYQELVLRMLGVSAEESIVVVERAHARKNIAKE